MDGKIPSSIQKLLKQYGEMLRDTLGDKVHGVYIYGSLATGAFDENKSDIDFMTILKTDVTQETVEQLQSIHKRLKLLHPMAVRLEGEYVPLADVITSKPSKTYPYFAFGKFQGYVGIKSMAWYQIVTMGIPVCGEKLDTVVKTVDWKIVEEELRDRLENYWPGKAGKFALGLLDGWFTLIILNICRIYYALDNRTFTTKTGGGEYVLTKIPQEWHPLIREALRVQNGQPGPSEFSSRLKRMRKMQEFVDCMASRKKECRLRGLGVAAE